MLAAVYGLQAIIFILKREFMLIGWMVLYLAAWVPKYRVTYLDHLCHRS